ncbi:AAA family ATPase [Noviherbaspirillum agri]
MKIAVISRQTGALAELRQILEEHCSDDKLNFLESRGGTLSILSDLEKHDLLIVDCAEPHRTDMEAIEALTHEHPKLAVLLLCTTKAPDLLIAAMRAGVREVLSSPVIADELVAAIARVRKRMPVAEPEKKRGKILAFLSSKGGSGATFIATNLGYALATQHDKKVLLIDLDFQHGDASFFVADGQPVTSVAEVAKQTERLDASVLASSSMQVDTGYSLLTAPDDPEKAIGLMPDHIDRLLTVAAENYDFVIVDIERAVDMLSIRALDRSDLIFLVLQPMVPYVRDSKKLLRLFQTLGYTDNKIHLLGNRSDTATDLPPKIIERTLGTRFYRMLPNDFVNASASVNLGTPVLRHAASCPISRALKELASDLVGATKDHESWIGRFFRGTHHQSGFLN